MRLESLPTTIRRLTSYWSFGRQDASRAPLSRVLQLVRKATVAFRINDWALNQVDPHGLKYLATISVRGHWFIVAKTLVEVEVVQDWLIQAPRVEPVKLPALRG